MKGSDFQKLVLSVRQAGEIRRGELRPAKVTEVDQFIDREAPRGDGRPPE